MKKDTGPFFSPNAKFYLRDIGGLATVDRINNDLLLLDREDIKFRALTLGGLHFDFLDSGSDRRVFRHGNIVLKFQVNSYDKAYGNLTEWLVYQEAYRMKIHRHFAATVALLTDWRYGPVIIQEFVRGARNHQRDAKATNARYARLFENEVNTLDIIPFDLHADNVLGGKAIDFGRFSVKSDTLQEAALKLYAQHW